AWEKAFNLWLIAQNKTLNTLHHNDLMLYVLQDNAQLKRASLLHLLNRLHWLFRCHNLENPLQDFKPKSVDYNGIEQYLNEEQLLQIWMVFQQNVRISDALKIALCILIFQGITTAE